MQEYPFRTDGDLTYFLQDAGCGAELIVQNTSTDGHVDQLIFKITKVLKLSRVSEVILAKFADRKVTIKIFFEKEASAIIENTQTELDIMQSEMGDGQFRVFQYLFSFPKLGLMVFEFFPGQRISECIFAAAPTKRAKLFQRSGLWLKKYGDIRTYQEPLSLQYWQSQLADKHLLFAGNELDKALQERLRQDLLHRLEALRGTRLKKAVLPDDFTGNNLIVNSDVFCGIDIHYAHKLPLTNPAARFLVWLQLRDNIKPEKTKFGISEQYLQHFLKPLDLPDFEINTSLPFFIGVYLYSRFEFFTINKNIATSTRRVITNFLED